MSRCRLKEWYNIVVRPDLMAKMQYTNTHAVPKLSALSVNVTTKQASSGLDNAVPAAFILELVTGQTAALTRVKRANAMYKVRPGHLEGAKVTLHGEQMWNFMDRLVTIALPRQTDFAGLSHDSFDGNGNYAIGIRDVNTFLEVEAQHGNMLGFKLDSARGCGIYITTTAETDAEAKVLLSALRFPFAPLRRPPAPAKPAVG